MFSKLREFVIRHRRKFVVGGVFIGGTILISRFIHKVQNFPDRETKELLQSADKRSYYEQIERTCDQAALNMEQTLKSVMNSLLATDDIVNKLTLGSVDKVALWEELKILTFSKISLLVYVTSALVITLRIQLSLIGGYVYRQNSKYCVDDIQLSGSVQDKYMKQCYFLLHDGSKELCDLITEKVRSVIGNTSLKTKLTIHDIEQIFWAIQSAMNNDKRDPCKTLVNYVLPEEFLGEPLETDLNIFNKMITETRDLFESDEVMYLMKSCVSRGFSFIMDGLAGYFVKHRHVAVPGTSSTNDLTVSQSVGFQLPDMNSFSMSMAKLIPIINGFLQNSYNTQNIFRDWVAFLIVMDPLKVMSANVYETFCCKG